MKCIISLTIQYMVVYTALGICRSYLDFTKTPYADSAVQTALKSASETMFYAPMVCLMFVGFRMRVLQLTKGTGNPQDWVRMSMQAVTYSILANTLMVMLIPIVTAKEVKTDDEGMMDQEGANPFENSVLAIVFTVIRYVVFLGLYVGFGAVCVGVFLFKPPAGVWDGPIPPVSPAVACTMILSVTFFMIYFLVAVSRSYSQFSGGNLTTSKFETVMLRAADTLAFAPMLSVLFLGARMRALQMDPVGGNPRPWAQNCFYACTYCLICQTALACVVPLLLSGKVEKNDKIEGDFKYELPNTGSVAAKCLTVFRFLLMLTLYGCTLAVVCSVFTIEHPDGKEKTPPLSPTMQCVLNLVFQYFIIYLLLWIYYTIEDFAGLDMSILAAAKDAIESAKATVQFAPMLAVLFIATRMRALQMTQNKGAPQGWVQDGMYLASWAVLIQFMMCLLMPIFTGKKFTPDTLDGAQKTTDEDSEVLQGFLSFTKWDDTFQPQCSTQAFHPLLFSAENQVPSDSPVFSCLQRSLPLSNNDTKQFKIRLHCRHLRKPGCSLILKPCKFFSGFPEQPGLLTQVVQVSAETLPCSLQHHRPTPHLSQRCQPRGCVPPILSHPHPLL